MARELITDAELLTIAHRQGFRSIEEVESCILEPGGALNVEGKKPAAADLERAEVLARLDALARQVEDLKRQLPPARPDSA